MNINIMNNYIYTNSNILSNKINYLITNSIKKNKNNNCPICNKEFKLKYYYKDKNNKIKISENQYHLLLIHNIIDINFYKLICEFKLIDDYTDWYILSTNGLHILDGLFEIGSNQIYIEKNKNIKNTKIIRFSEHHGFVHFEKNKISNITVLNNMRTESSDPFIYMPNNCIEALNVDYIFHTHPKTPYIGSRIKNGIIFEFPSIADIIHFIEHHNNGKLLGSIIIAPEGIYIIRKNIFNRKNIKVDYDIMINNLENIFMECYNDSHLKYSSLNYNQLKVNNEIMIPEKYFYEKIAIDYEYIERINNVLIKYDIFIDYYARILLDKNEYHTFKWIFPDIYVPYIN